MIKRGWFFCVQLGKGLVDRCQESLCTLGKSLLGWHERCHVQAGSGKQGRKELREKQREQSYYPHCSWGFGGLGNWRAMALPCFLLAASHVTSPHPSVLPWYPTLTKPDQPQELVHGAAILVSSGQIRGMGNGRDYLCLGSAWAWQPLVPVAVWVYKTCNMWTERMY